MWISRVSSAITVIFLAPAERFPHAEALSSDVGHHFLCNESLDGVANVRGAEIRFLNDRCQNALHRALDLVDDVVNDRVETDIDLLAIRKLACFPVRAHIETNDDGIGS